MTNRIYTRRGDRGETSLIGEGRVPKDDPRIHALGELDEASSAIGLARAALCASSPSDARLDEMLLAAQQCLSECAAVLATPHDGRTGDDAGIDPEAIASLECFIDELSESAGTLEDFILPGGCEKGARLHLARSVVRRAERGIVALFDDDPAVHGVLAYVNRLSDALFTMAVHANAMEGASDMDQPPSGVASMRSS